MNMGVSRVTKISRRVSQLRTAKNTATNVSMSAFSSAEGNSPQGSDDMNCMDALFNMGNFAHKDKSNLEIMFANLTKQKKLPIHVVDAHIRAIVEHLQLEVNMDINNVELHLKDAKMLQEQLDWKEKMLNEELEIVKNDKAQYEWYINNQHYYDFKNVTWDSLIKLGRDELQNRWTKLQQMKSDLKNQVLALHQRMRICQILIWALKHEKMSRQQRLHTLSLCSHKQMNVSNILRDDADLLQNANCLCDVLLKNSMPSTSRKEGRESSILNKQEFGCSFEFLLRHRVNKGGSVSEYNDVVKIFEKKVPVFQSTLNSGKTKRLFEEFFKKQMSRLDREKEVSLLNACPADSDSQILDGLLYFSNLKEDGAGNLDHSQLDMYNSCVQSQKRNRVTLPSYLNQEQENSHDQSYSEQNQTQDLKNKHTMFTNDAKSKKQEIDPNSEQNGSKTINHTKTKGCEKENELVQCSHSEQGISIVAKQDLKLHEEQKNQKEREKSPEKNGAKTDSCTNVKLLKKKKKNNCNRYGLRSDSDLENVLKLELHSDSEIDIKPVSDSDLEHVALTKTTQQNDAKDKNDSVNHHANKKNKSEKTSEGNGLTKSPCKNKMESVKKLGVRLDSLETVVQEANLEFLKFKEAVVAFQRNMDEFKISLGSNNTCRRESGTEIYKSIYESEQMQEERKSDLVNCLKIMNTFLKRNDKLKNSIEARELFFSNHEKVLLIDDIEHLVLNAARDISRLPFSELKLMETKDLKLKHISGIVSLVQELTQYTSMKEDCFSDSSDSSL